MIINQGPRAETPMRGRSEEYSRWRGRHSLAARVKHAIPASSEGQRFHCPKSGSALQFESTLRDNWTDTKLR